MLNKLHEGGWIKLKGLTGHGRNRIHEHGEDWLITVMGHKNSKIMLRSKEKTFRIGGEDHFDGRWISVPTDKNFEIVEIIS